MIVLSLESELSIEISKSKEYKIAIVSLIQGTKEAIL